MTWLAIIMISFALAIFWSGRVQRKTEPDREWGQAGGTSRAIALRRATGDE